MTLEGLIGSLENLSEFNLEGVYEAVSRSTVGFRDLEKWIDYDYPVSDSYGRKMVHDGGFFEVMVCAGNPEIIAPYTTMGKLSLAWSRFLEIPNTPHSK